MAAREYAVTAAVVAALTGTAFMMKRRDIKEVVEIPRVLQAEGLGPKICQLIASDLGKILGDSLIKIVCQLQFWYDESLPESDMLELTRRLIATATICHSGVKVPKVRFGKTELQMPIVTCGGMRVQKTWFPDNLPISSSKSSVLKHPSQDNLLQLLRLCFKVGINHFETGRFYGTSEMQFADALWSLMQNGEIKREDFILQTKIPATENRSKWEDLFEQSWAHFGPRFGYIDLLSFWCVSSKTQVEQVLSDATDMPMAAALDYQKAGKIRHIGFSTHGSADNILRLINSNKFSYVNLHYHSFGSYHAEGTTDGMGGHGNANAVKRALELDMGVFNISPVDKGGMLYLPSKTVARLLGPNLSPIAFANLSSWKTNKFHTVSVGFARLSDVEESLDAARIYSSGSYEEDLKAAESRLAARLDEKLGKEWASKGLLHIPSCEVAATDGIGIGHVLWCYNLVKAFGMYDFAKARYAKLEEVVWKKSKSFEENIKKVPAFNLGRCFDQTVDYTEALAKHYDAQAAKVNMAKVHAWLSSKGDIDRQSMECESAYDLRIWETFPGDNPTVSSVLLGHVSFGLCGATGGPTKTAEQYAAVLRHFVSTSRVGPPN
jgi:predicted aldo/keto reductase-like oxidoreductase